MIRQSILILTTTFAAGLLFVNVYNSLIDAISWGSNMPASIQTTRDYYKIINPGNFFLVFTPINQVLTLLALIICWKEGKRIRIYCGAALLFAVAVDVMTFGFFYPRNDIMYTSPIDTNLDAIKIAWSQWSSMNWFRSGLQLINLHLDFAVMIYVLSYNKQQPTYQGNRQ
jgi:uncharacterized membrane protein